MCTFNGWFWVLKSKVWDLFANFITDKSRASLLWSPRKDTLVRST